MKNPLFLAPKAHFSRILLKSTAMLLIFLFVFPAGILLADEKNDQKTEENKAEKTRSEELSSEDILDVPVEKRDSDISNTIETNSKDKKEDEGGVAVDEPNPNLLAQLTIKSKVSENKNLLPDIDNMTGALVYEYPIVVPPGRNGMQPDIKLSYNNQNREYGSPVGFGWSLNIPYIQRVNRFGSERMYTDNIFTSSLSGELVLVSSSTSNSIYRAKVDNGSFLKYELSASGVWTVTDKSGATYVFGANASARQDNVVATTTRIYKWMLDETRDTNDNFVTYQYVKDGNQPYISKIIYTGHGTTDGIFEVEFLLEDRPDTIKKYDAVFETAYNKRISQIITKVNGAWVRKYDLGYTTAYKTLLSLLSSVTETGKDDGANITNLPATEFSYETVDVGFATSTSLTFPNTPFTYYSNSIRNNGVQLADVNGDGLIDVIKAKEGQPFVVYLHTDTGWASSSSWIFPEPFIDSTGKADMGTRLLDLDGDGLPEVIRYTGGGSSSNTVKKLYKNTGAGWIDVTSQWIFPEEYIIKVSAVQESGTRFADINGDGLTDYVVSRKLIVSGGSPYFVKKSYLNNGSGFVLNSNWTLPVDFATGASSNQYLFANDAGFFDANGDGLSDILYCEESGDFLRHIYLNTGNGSWTHYLSTLPNEAPCFLDYTQGRDLGKRPIDLNDDGLMDIGWYRLSTSCQGSFYNNGTDFAHNPNDCVPYQISNTNGVDLAARLEDLNGDGLTDEMKYGYQESAPLISLHKGKKAHVLKSIKNSTQGVVDVEYSMTTMDRDSSGNLNSPKLPITMQTVSKISLNDGFATTSETTYKFKDGLYYFNSPQDRKFAGFGTVTKTDSVGNVTKTYFHQGNETATSSGEYDDHISKLGKPYRIEQYDANGNLFTRTINKWDKADIGNGASFVKLAQSLEQTFDGDSTHRDKAQTSVYDDTNGNQSQNTSWGEVSGASDGSFTDTGVDKTTTSIEYATSSSGAIFAPSKETLFDQVGTKIKETKKHYDDLSFGFIEKGNNTKTEYLKSGTDYINTQSTYNTYGLVTQEKDPLGNTTNYSYDIHNLYPATTTNALGQTTSYVYDYSAGKPKQATDANGFKFEIVRDGFDRVTEEKQPDLDSPTNLVTKTTYAYDDASFPTSVTKTDYLDASLSVATHTYFDGFGRTIQERRKAEDANTFAVKDTAYNSQGLKSKESLPYFSTGSVRTSPTTTTALWNNFTYDPLGRVVSISNVVGNTTNTYSDWKLTVTDANGKTKDLYKDAQGNLVQVDEHNGTSTYTTLYEWNKLGNLTKITDALGNIRNFTYDALGRRLTAEDLHAPTDTYFSTWTYAYDDAGNIVSIIDGKAQTINYTYDALNRALSEDFTGQSGTEISYGYDWCASGIGKLCSATTSSVVSKFSYNPLGQIEAENKKIGGTWYDTTFDYDRAGNQALITYPNGMQVKYEYGAGGQVEKISQSESDKKSFVGVVEDLDYSPEGKIAFQLNHNDTNTTNTYDAGHLYRLTSKVTDGPAGGITSILQDLHYTYDNVGNITQLSDVSETNNSKTILYTYDDLSRLLSASSTVMGGGPAFKEVFAYSPIGNITDKSDTGAYIYVSTGTNVWSNPHAVTAIARVPLTYDKNGNTLSFGGTATSTWDYTNHLISQITGATTTTFTYDQSGERLSLSNADKTTYYPNKYYNIATTTATTTTTSHIYLGDDAIATVQKVGSASSTIQYIHTDHLSGANITTDKDGLVTEIADYYPYGQIRYNPTYNSGFKEQRKFTGHEYDEETGLNYMGARYQNPNVGRFVSVDAVFQDLGDPEKVKQLTNKPQEFFLSDPQQLNSYSYARNNPINMKDADGHSAVPINPWVLAAMILFSSTETSYDPVYETTQYNEQNNPLRKTENLAMGFVAPEIGGTPKGWLARHEGPGLGHTIAEHVGKTASELAQRLVDNPSLRRVSSFYSELTAENAVGNVLRENRGKIDNWLKNTNSNRLELVQTGKEDIGLFVDKATGVVQNVKNTVVVLYKNTKGYFIKTSYPKK